MRTVAHVLALATSLALAAPAYAGHHNFVHAVDSFVDAWNARNPALLETEWSADTVAVDMRGRVARGRVAAAKLFASGRSPVHVVSTPIAQRQKDGSELVDVDVEIGGVVHHMRVVLVWGPDLPGGHHPDGRLFISSLAVTPLRSPLLAWLHTWIGR